MSARPWTSRLRTVDLRQIQRFLFSLLADGDEEVRLAHVDCLRELSDRSANRWASFPPWDVAKEQPAWAMTRQPRRTR